MKRWLNLFLVFGLLACPAAQGSDSWVNQSFDKMKSLAGSWSGKDDEGQPATLTYEVTSGGTVVMERLTPGKWPCMITMYHIDGDKLMCTHYCNRNNQPRMSADMYDGKNNSLKFAFLDATNLPKAEDGHMHSLIVTFPDKNHLIQDWEWKEGDDHRHSIFQFQKQQ